MLTQTEKLQGVYFDTLQFFLQIATVPPAQPNSRLSVSVRQSAYPTPHLASLAERGVRAASMLPAFPSKTFPNHYALVTGLYPAHHGIVANVLYDPVFDETFTMSKRRAVEHPRWWEGEPLWVTAEMQGVPPATYFWPGSEAPIKGVRPTFWKRVRRTDSRAGTRG